jgi:transposase InsO family protein
MVRYRSRRPPDIELRTRLRDLANQRRRFGYRRLFILLREQGEPSGVNRSYRLYREEGLTVRKRKARRKAVGTRTPILVEAKVNARWSLDFVHDQFALGRRFRILNIVDDVTRECLAAIPDTSISGKRVARELTVLIGVRGKPQMIVSDNGTEFTSNAILARAIDHQVEWHYIAPGKPMQNGYIESFNGRRRDELLNESLFLASANFLTCGIVPIRNGMFASGLARRPMRKAAVGMDKIVLHVDNDQCLSRFRNCSINFGLILSSAASSSTTIAPRDDGQAQPVASCSGH